MTRNAAVLGRPLAVELGAAPRRVADATGPRRRDHPVGRGVRISAFAVALGGAGDEMHPDEKAPTPPRASWPCPQRCNVRVARWP